MQVNTQKFANENILEEINWTQDVSLNSDVKE